MEEGGRRGGGEGEWRREGVEVVGEGVEEGGSGGGREWKRKEGSKKGKVEG